MRILFVLFSPHKTLPNHKCIELFFFFLIGRVFFYHATFIDVSKHLRNRPLQESTAHNVYITRGGLSFDGTE